MDPREKNRLSNLFRKEADQLNIGSPYRIKEYIEYRIKGLSKEKAIEKTKSRKA
jgi:hypothetical protein